MIKYIKEFFRAVWEDYKKAVRCFDIMQEVNENNEKSLALLSTLEGDKIKIYNDITNEFFFKDVKLIDIINSKILSQDINYPLGC